MDSPVRTFVALPLPGSLLKSIARQQQALVGDYPMVRWSRPETLHLTLHFLGNLPKESLACAGKTVLSVGLSTAPFTMKISALGALPSRRRPRVIVLELAPCEALKELHAKLGRELAAQGFSVESRPFRPHLTIGRVRRKERCPAPPVHCALSNVCVEATELILFESRLDRDGARHLPRLRAPLSGEPSTETNITTPNRRPTDGGHQ